MPPEERSHCPPLVGVQGARLVTQGRGYRLTGEVFNKNTVADIVTRHRDKATHIA